MDEPVLFLLMKLSGFCIALLGFFGSVVQANERPNILYFYVDDMGWGSIGPNAQAERRAKGLATVQTPNLDKLAAEGINFRRGYGCMVCSPARSSQQTGFHQGHTFADRNDPDNAKKAIREDDITIGDALLKAGYVTGYWGKWGYGGSKERESPTIDNVQTLPTSHGYQHVVAELHHVRAHTFFQPTLWTAPAPEGSKGDLYLEANTMKPWLGNGDYPDEPAKQNHPDYPETAYCDDVYCFAALDFVREAGQRYQKDGIPFFGLLAVQIPHAPFDEIKFLPEWDAAYADDAHFSKLKNQSREWAAMVTRIDAHFGNILAALEDPNNDGDNSDSVADNTLVIFMSDNGGPGGANNSEFDANGGLTGTKGSINEGGIRVPTVMRWPAMITETSELKRGTSTDMAIDVTDLLPTFCELAGTEIPLGLDGVSLAPLLTGKGERRPREFLIHEAGKGHSIIRRDHKLIRRPNGDLEVYDLAEDPAETTNLAEKFPILTETLDKMLTEERVDEPKGFANTYHHWEGKNGAKLSKAGNWSDYAYANEGITYIEDDGAPQLSWTAHLRNSGKGSNTAVADKDTNFLALEVGAADGVSQSLKIGDGVTVTGRNEVRVTDGGTIDIEGGKVASVRWVDVKKGGMLNGAGSVEGILYNEGTVAVVPSAAAGMLIVAGDYREEEGSRLHLEIAGKGIHVKGEAELAGILSVETVPRAKVGELYEVVSADSVTGRFANAGDRVQAGDGTELRVGYEAGRVTLTVVSPLQLSLAE